MKVVIFLPELLIVVTLHKAGAGTVQNIYRQVQNVKPEVFHFLFPVKVFRSNSLVTEVVFPYFIQILQGE